MTVIEQEKLILKLRKSILALEKMQHIYNNSVLLTGSWWTEMNSIILAQIQELRNQIINLSVGDVK